MLPLFGLSIKCDTPLTAFNSYIPLYAFLFQETSHMFELPSTLSLFFTHTKTHTCSVYLINPHSRILRQSYQGSYLLELLEFWSAACLVNLYSRISRQNYRGSYLLELLVYRVVEQYWTWFQTHAYSHHTFL